MEHTPASIVDSDARQLRQKCSRPMRRSSWSRRHGRPDHGFLVVPLGLPRFDPSIAGRVGLNLRFETRWTAPGDSFRTTKRISAVIPTVSELSSNGDLLQALQDTSTAPQSSLGSSEMTQDLDGNILPVMPHSRSGWNSRSYSSEQTSKGREWSSDQMERMSAACSTSMSPRTMLRSCWPKRC